jgi:2-phosphosulfolactate phosphatase
MAEMIVTRDSLLEGVLKGSGMIVVVDVFRAFTCTPFMFALGLERSILVSSPEEAFVLKEADPTLLLVGEVDGIPVEGFDLGNSPSRILQKGRSFFEGKTAVQRSTAGVQGALTALERADEVLLCSYCVAGATARYLLSKNPRRVSIVGMGVKLKEKAPEDEWCACYLANLLGAAKYDHTDALAEILFQETTQKFLRGDRPEFPAEDPILCLQVDMFDFALQAVREGGMVLIERLAR